MQGGQLSSQVASTPFMSDNQQAQPPGLLASSHSCLLQRQQLMAVMLKGQPSTTRTSVSHPLLRPGNGHWNLKMSMDTVVVRFITAEEPSLPLYVQHCSPLFGQETLQRSVPANLTP